MEAKICLVFIFLSKNGQSCFWSVQGENIFLFSFSSVSCRTRHYRIQVRFSKNLSSSCYHPTQFFSSEQWEYPLQFFYLLYSQWEIICPALLFLVGLQLNSKCTFGLGKKSAAVSGEEWYFEPAGFTLLFSAKPTQEENTGYFSKGSLQGGLTNNGLNASFFFHCFLCDSLIKAKDSWKKYIPTGK